MPGIAELYVETANNNIAKHIANNTAHKIHRANIDWLILTALDASNLDPSYKFAWYDAILHSKNFDIFWLGLKSAHRLPDSAMLPYTPNTTLQEFDVTVAGASDDISEVENDVEEAANGNLEQSQYGQQDTKKRKRSNSSLRIAIDSRLADLDSGAAEPGDTTYRSKSKKHHGDGKRGSTKKTPTVPKARAGLKALAPVGAEHGISAVQGLVPNNNPTATTPSKAKKSKKAITPRARRTPKLTAKAKATTATAQANMEPKAQNPVPAQPELLPASKGAMDPVPEANTTVVAVDGVKGTEEYQSLFGDGISDLLATKPGRGQEFAVQVAEEAAKLAARSYGLLS